MSYKARIVVVEDDVDVSTMLNIYLSTQGYQVSVAARGDDAVVKIQELLPDLILLDIMLPGLDGYDVCRELRNIPRTSHIPIIFLTQRSERSDKIAGLELGADDYITKPFDIEELRLRVQVALRTNQRINLTNPTTGLPSGRLIEDELRPLANKEGWTLLQLKIDSFDNFTTKYGLLAGEEVLKFTAKLLNDTVSDFGSLHDFVGHLGGQSFVLITYCDKPANLVNQLKDRFNEPILNHYDFSDRLGNGVSMPDGSIKPFMKLLIGGASSVGDFADTADIITIVNERMLANAELSDYLY